MSHVEVYYYQAVLTLSSQAYASVQNIAKNYDVSIFCRKKTEQQLCDDML